MAFLMEHKKETTITVFFLSSIYIFINYFILFRYSIIYSIIALKIWIISLLSKLLYLLLKLFHLSLNLNENICVIPMLL